MSDLTKRAIRSSFIKFLNQKPLDKITVKDIVEDCGVNRNTFYYHYQDIYALLQDVFEEEIASCRIDVANIDNWRDSFSKAVDFVLTNKRGVYHVFNSARRELLEKYFMQVLGKYTKEYVLSQAHGLNISEDDLEYVTVFYKHAFMGIMVEWILTDMSADPMAGINRFADIFDGSIRRTLEKISK